jgi:hypothetical protein
MRKNDHDNEVDSELKTILKIPFRCVIVVLLQIDIMLL